MPTKAHRHANARPKPRNARRISGGAIRRSQVPVPSGTTASTGNTSAGGATAELLERYKREKKRERDTKGGGRRYINHRNERATGGAGFSNRNKVEDSQARRLGEYGHHFSSASALLKAHVTA